MGKIIVNGKEFTFQQLKEGKWPPQAPYFQAALSFCNDWLHGADAFELYTSGSTGSPKTVLVSRAQMSSSAKATGEFFDIPQQASLLCCLNTAMIAGKMMLVRAMEWDSRLHLVEPSSKPLSVFPLNQTFDFASMVPLQLENCFADAHCRELLHRIKNLLIGGSPPSDLLRKKAAQLAGNVFQSYGMTETVSHIALADLKAPGPLRYKILPGVQIQQDQERRLKIMAPMSSHKWITTNDIVEVSPGAETFIWKGRADFTINSGGIKVQPEEVEALAGEVMKDHFPGRRYFITSLPDPSLGQKVVLLVEGQKDRSRDLKQLLDMLKKELPSYHSPKSIFFVPKFVETASNKINRRKTVEAWRALSQS